MIQLDINQKKIAHKYKEKWRNIALSTQKIEYNNAINSVKQMYSFFELEVANIVFFSSPYNALEKINQTQSRESFLDLSVLGINFIEEMANENQEVLNRDIFDEFDPFNEAEKISIFIERSLEEWSDVVNNRSFYHCLKPKERCAAFSIIDFLAHALNVSIDETKYEIFSSVIQSCGWIFPFEKTCLVCERPTRLTFDKEGKLHSDKKPAIEFSDGFGVYIYHGRMIEDIYPDWVTSSILCSLFDKLES
ncbi:MAG: hypothetical protein J7519_11610 [Roseofilum sp. SID1]|uniref:DUF6745 domain-containing protein n=1 Tax=Roseofilum sp. SID1 TaxID=2821497 RepID=UPI001B194EA6|nr:hypothetical protein [Roseofilum sp. SID1]MBP0038335.1 hypothetical protein [Roseofilum sp. SID1]